MKPSKKPERNVQAMSRLTIQIPASGKAALQKHSYSARGATKMLLSILFARLDALIERTAMGSESV